MTAYRRVLVSCVCLLAFILPAWSQSKPYQPTWESLERRPLPAWFEDAKFGIFFHWGLYSVPAWSPRGSYAEWYQYWLTERKVRGLIDVDGNAVFEHHIKKYGRDFPYQRFADMFTAEGFDANEWAKLIEDSGAKYAVLVTKHHDGFALWPSKQASEHFGRPWNTYETAAHRDIVGEYAAAFRKTNLKVGMYYSLYEWYDPLWQKPDKSDYVERHFLPQVKDLVVRYKPDLLWADGDWELPDTAWKSREFLAWLYNESPVKDGIIVNDRWGGGRLKHGGYFTPEYEPGLAFDRAWEECRGIGYSFGFNNVEDVQDYASPEALVLMLSEIVSNGGNLLLDVGPDATGKIPPIMQERLLQMGQWLRVNGEAIYRTRKWKRSVQWSEGDRGYKPQGLERGGRYILKETLDPDPGYAAKQMFFTSTDSNVYAIVPKFPVGSLVIKDMTAAPNATVTLLGTRNSYAWKQSGADLTVSVPKLGVNESTVGYAYVFKLTGVQ
jgi:alpha-L-fucosidase